jgi:hypothetical protein
MSNMTKQLNQINTIEDTSKVVSPRNHYITRIDYRDYKRIVLAEVFVYLSRIKNTNEVYETITKLEKIKTIPTLEKKVSEIYEGGGFLR